VALIASPGDRTDRGGDRFPEVYPQNWPFGSVAATVWFMFAELGANPFAVPADVHPSGSGPPP